MIHPDPGDIVAIGFELAREAADNGGIAAIHANPGKVFEQQMIYLPGFHDQQSQNVLPKIAPAAAAAPVIMIRQERVAEQAAQCGLDAHPLQPQIEVITLVWKARFSSLLRPIPFFPGNH